MNPQNMLNPFKLLNAKFYMKSLWIHVNGNEYILQVFLISYLEVSIFCFASYNFYFFVFERSIEDNFIRSTLSHFQFQLFSVCQNVRNEVESRYSQILMFLNEVLTSENMKHLAFLEMQSISKSIWHLEVRSIRHRQQTPDTLLVCTFRTFGWFIFTLVSTPYENTKACELQPSTQKRQN